MRGGVRGDGRGSVTRYLGGVDAEPINAYDSHVAPLFPQAIAFAQWGSPGGRGAFWCGGWVMKQIPEDATCVNCRWYQPDYIDPGTGIHHGECQVNPPVVVTDGRGSYDTAHPSTTAGGLCRRWTPEPWTLRE